ncbi:glycosyltransferase [Ancylobacter sp. WKF20]|uniref:glycosyltransferase n=1 Tax=Ancylobacter sp. WKF20 TaxID=3039801 RepID=UPI00243443AD|nr:glycosyltransferase [Ancylobacter sp. WKF20]WGD30731.1 glycosyltransferase [Ancylobacter sp. WKF20]
MKILLANAYFVTIGGSERILLEMAEHFRARGHDVTVFASVAGPPIADLFRTRLGIEIVTDPAAVTLFAYDLAYLQHHVAGLFDYRLDAASRARTAVVFGKLGRRTFMESGGWRHDRILADAYLANSELTAERLIEVGVTAPVTVFHNAAPAAYFRPDCTAGARLRTITAVTNHSDPALMAALDILERDYTVHRLGASQGGQRLLTPEMVAASDVVISIGKTVPYALAARVPVFVYDHFGGPGYLSAENLARAARYNFTGRCCERRLDASALAREIVELYPAGRAFTQKLRPTELDRYRLEPYLDALLATPGGDNAARTARLAADPMIAQERLLAAHLHEQYRRKPPERRSQRRLRSALTRARGLVRSFKRACLRPLARLLHSFSA